MTYKPNIREVAKLAEVSTATVSRVVNGKYRNNSAVRQRVEAALKQTGYVRKKRARLCGNILCISDHQLGDMSLHGVPMERKLVELASAEKYKMLTLHSGDINVITDMIREFDIAGVISLSCKMDVSFSYRVDTAYQHHAVDSDDIAGMKMIINYLAKNGHRRIGFFGAGIMSVEYGHPRFGALHRLCQAAGIDYDPSLYFYEKFGYMEHAPVIERAVDYFMSQPDPPTALVLAADVYASCFYETLRNKGFKVPQEIGVIGFDDEPLSALLSPALTTVCKPLQQMAEEALKLLLEMIANETHSNHRVLVCPELIIRDSVKKQKDAVETFAIASVLK